ncbi:MAG: hypothetical protein FDZ75_01055 [Actinobacteria bacterium]|nr:MAG: hypothetical protein FDZ75_01055 [Actinomycetota bacterium]
MAFYDKLPAKAAIDFTHDIAAGLWPGAVTAMWLLQRGAEKSGAGLAPRSAYLAVWWVFALALVALPATGLVRMRYWRLNVRSGALEVKTRLVQTKHALFVVMMVVVTAWAAMLMPPPV